MECLLPFLFVSALVIGLVVFASKAQRWANSWNVGYQAVAQRYGAHFTSATWFSRPTMRINYGQTFAVVSTSAGRQGGLTQVLIHWPDRVARVEVSSHGWSLSPRIRGVWDLEIDESLHEHFKIRGNNADMVHALFSEGVRWQITRLREFCDPQELYVSISRGGMLIRKPGHIKRADQLDDFVRFSLELFDQAMLTRTTGIEFVNADTAQLIEQVKCQVCGDDIHGQMVFCVRCRTPHCRECWEYTGQCSTFACGETRFIAPIVATPVEPAGADADEPEAE